MEWLEIIIRSYDSANINKRWFELLVQIILTAPLAVSNIHIHGHCQTYWGTVTKVCYNTANFNIIATAYVIHIQVCCEFVFV